MNLLVCVALVPSLVWASDAVLAPGVPSFHQVDDRVYRGGRPTNQGCETLAKLGIKTVIDLEGTGARSRRERAVVEALGMRYVSIPLPGLQAPSDEQVFRVLDLLETTEGPVFVHCWRGRDRAGLVIACYRITHDGWGNREALQEARAHGMSSFERGMQHYILRFRPPARIVANPAAGSARVK